MVKTGFHKVLAEVKLREKPLKIFLVKKSKIIKVEFRGINNFKDRINHRFQGTPLKLNFMYKKLNINNRILKKNTKQKYHLDK